MLARFITSAAFILSSFEGIVAVSSNTEVNVFERSPDALTLLPHTKRTSGLKTRDIGRRALHPQTQVVLPYGEDSRSSNGQHLFAVDITLTSHDSVPIVLLEDFEHLTSSITCLGDSIKITFSDSSDFAYTQDLWDPLEEFVLISSHPESGCNPGDERGVYKVTNTHCDASTSTVELSAEPLSFHDAAKRLSVDFGHTTREDFHRDLIKRQATSKEIEDDEEDDTFNFRSNSSISLDTSFPPRITLYPIDLPVAVAGTGNSPLDVQVTCVGCGVSGQLVVRGHLDIDPDFTEGAELEWAWAEIEVTKAIKTTMQLELFLAIKTKEWDFPLLPNPIPFTPFQVPGVISVGPEFDYRLLAALGFGSMEANFTYGAVIDVPVGSIARFDFKETNSSFARGWDKTTLNQIPFSVNSLNGNLDLSLNVTAQPSVAFKVTMLNAISDGLSAGPSIDFAAPKILLAIKQLDNVTKSCTSPGENDYEYYEDAFQFSTNWELGVSLSLSAEADFPILPSLSTSISAVLYTHTFTPNLVCLVFDGVTKTGELKPAESVSPLIDVAKVQASVDKTGHLPSGVDPSLLATYTASGPLSTSIVSAVDEAKGVASSMTIGGGGILSLLVAVAAVAMAL